MPSILSEKGTGDSQFLLPMQTRGQRQNISRFTAAFLAQCPPSLEADVQRYPDMVSVHLQASHGLQPATTDWKRAYTLLKRLAKKHFRL